MLNYFHTLPLEKEKRILISGEGQEALLVTHYLAQHKRLRAEIPNLKIYLVQPKNSVLAKVDDIDKEDSRGPITSKIKFWLEYAKHKLSQRVYEITFLSYNW